MKMSMPILYHFSWDLSGREIMSETEGLSDMCDKGMVRKRIRVMLELEQIDHIYTQFTRLTRLIWDRRRRRPSVSRYSEERTEIESVQYLIAWCYRRYKLTFFPSSSTLSLTLSPVISSPLSAAFPPLPPLGWSRPSVAPFSPFFRERELRCDQ